MTGDDFVQLIGLGAWVTFITVAIVTLAESQVSALRLPDGDVYRIVGGNRFAAAAILGVVVALTIALFEYSISNKMNQYGGFRVVLSFAVGFVSAEAAVGRRFGGSPKGDVSAPADGSIVPWSLGRTAARTAIGSIVGTLLTFASLAVPQATRDSSVIGRWAEDMIVMGAGITFISVAIVTVAESELPRVRLPSGDVYQIVGGNRFAAAAVLGVVVALAIGLPVVALNGRLSEYNINVALFFAAGFVIAEAVVGRRFSNGVKSTIKAP